VLIASVWVLGLCTPTAGAADEHPSPQVVVTGWLSSSSAATGEDVRFWITISNQTDAPIDKVHLEHFDTPGFKIARRCWTVTPEPQCGVPKDFPDPAPMADPDEIAVHLDKGQTRTIWGDLVADHSNSPQSVVAVISWSTGSSGQSWSSASLGQVASLTKFERRWMDLRDFVKDVGLPILLLLLSVGFGFYQHSRDSRAEDRAHKRSVKEQEQQTERTQLSETWNQMLPESHRVARDHYLPLWGAAQQMIDKVDAFREAEKKKDATAAHAHRRMAFYHMMMFAWHARESNRKIGGYYFKSRVGEKLAYNSYMKYFTLYGDDEHTITRRSKLLDLLNARMTMANFLALNDSPGYSQSTWQGAWDDFCAWLASTRCDETLKFLRGFIAVVEYESNRPYQLWYGSNYPMPVMDSTVNSGLESLTDKDLDLKTIQTYIAEARKGA
jgi:hypothetical protein